MVMRGSAARRLVGNPLGGILQEAHRKARKPTRTTGRTDDTPPREPVQEPVAAQSAPRPDRPRPLALAVVVVTDEDGRVQWTFSQPLPAPPVLTALPAGTAPVLAVLEQVTTEGAVVRVWTVKGKPAAGLAVHLTATTPLPAPS